jgi:hypothetical protein
MQVKAVAGGDESMAGILLKLLNNHCIVGQAVNSFLVQDASGIW